MNKVTGLGPGGVENILKNSLRGVTQVNKEGFYNESGDYILHQITKMPLGAFPQPF